MKGIADTGLLVGFANRKDQHHDWAVSIAEQLSEPLLTCEAVLAETAFHLGNCSVVFDMVREGLVALEFNCAEHLSQLQGMAKRYADRKPDLADLCLVGEQPSARGQRLSTGLQADGRGLAQVFVPVGI